jgi:hypothetical protein
LINKNQLILHVVTERLHLQALLTAAAYQLFPVGVLSIIEQKDESPPLHMPPGEPVTQHCLRVTGVIIPPSECVPHSFPRADAETLKPKTVEDLLSALLKGPPADIKRNLPAGISIPDAIVSAIDLDAEKMVTIVQQCKNDGDAILFAPTKENNTACDVVAVICEKLAAPAGEQKPRVHIYLIEVRDRRQAEADEVTLKLDKLAAQSLLPLVKARCPEVEIILHFVFAGRAPVTTAT